MPFVDLKAQYRALQGSIEARIRAVLERGDYILGREVGELEERLAAYVGVRHAIGCASGTDALLLALMALGVGPGDAVFTTPFTFIATAEVISLLGATPIFVDVDPATCNLAPSELVRALRALRAADPTVYPLPSAATAAGLRPAGVIAVDLYGLPADYDALEPLCRAEGLFLLEDAAQSFGALCDGRRACAFGDVAATSFFPAKPLGCYGDGGMVFAGRDDLTEVLRSLRVHGKGRHKYDNVRIGLNARLDTLQAAVVLAKFDAFPAELEARDRVAAAYGEVLEGVPGLVAPRVPPGRTSAWAQYTIRVAAPRRAAVEAALAEQGIPTAVYYPTPLHLQSAFAPLEYREGDFPQSERASREVLSLPFGPYLDEAAARRAALVLAATLERE